MKKSASIVLIVLFIACSPRLVKFTNYDAERAAAKFPGATMATLNQGQEYYKQNCGKCHPHKKPSSRNEEQWRKIVPLMVGKVNKKAGKQVLDSTAEHSILVYMVTMTNRKK